MVLSLNSKISVMTVFLTCSCFAQKDPGVRGGPPGAGGPLPGLIQDSTRGGCGPLSWNLFVTIAAT
jgi:hypothetical protein